MEKVVIQLEADTTQVVKGIDKVDESLQETNQAVGGLTNSLDKMTGGAITGFRNLKGGLVNAVKGFKSLKVAIAATGIGVLVLAFGSLVTFFTKTQRGADLLKKAMDGLGATISVLTDRASSVGEAFTLFFQGEFSAGFDKLKESVSGVTDEIVKETKAAYELAGALQAVEDREIGLIESTAERRKEISRLRLVTEDENKSYKERIAALDEAIRIEGEILQEQLDIAKERARISAEQVALGESSRDEIRQNAQLQAQVSELEERSLQFSRSIFTRRNALIRQEQAEQKSLLEARKVTSISEQSDLEQGLSIKAEIAAKDILLTKQTEEQKYNLISEFAQLGAEAEIEWAAMTQKQKIQTVQQGLSSLAANLGKETAAGKAAAISSALISTYQGAQDSYKSLAGIPIVGPALGFAAAAAATVAGLANVKAITSTKTPQVAGGGGTPSISAPSTPRPQPPAFNIVGAGAGNQLAETIAGQSQKPIKAFVTSQDVTTAQSLERNIVEGASI
jgi:hypothetical protein